MTTPQNPYNQQPQWQEQPMMPLTSMVPPPPRQRGVPGRPMFGKGQAGFPEWLTKYGILVYIMALAVVTAVYSSYSLPWYYMLSGVVSVLLFFGYGQTLTKRLSDVRVRNMRRFERRIFWIAFIPRVVWMLLIYTIFMQTYGDPFGFDNADALFYDELGQFVANLMNDGNFHFYDEISGFSGHNDISDMGYGIYVGLVYWLTGSGGVETVYGIGGDSLSIITLRLLKCIWSALTVVLVYQLAKRNFSEQTARMAAIFCALWPNFWYYCGCHLKEVEMVFLTVLFVEQADQMLRSRQFTAWKVIPVLLIGAAIFTFRTPLAVVAILSLLFTIVMSSSRVVSWGKRVTVGVFAIALIAVTMGERIQEQSRKLVETAQSGSQKGNMEWRAQREHGNAFAKYASKSIFAPLIFTIPFPTMVRPYEGQEVQQLNNGGNYIKNIISCFTIFAIIMLLISGKWRDHLLPLSFTLGYLVVLVMSVFAQAERFHQPIMPFEFMFAAYGLSVAVTNRKYRRWFGYWCGVMFIAAIAWNWFKLAGRGLA